MSTLRTGLHLQIITIAKMLAGVGMMVLTTRLLGAEGRGVLTMAFIASNILGMFGGLGADYSAQTQIGRGQTSLGAGYRSALRVASLIAILVTGLLLIGAWLAPGVVGPQVPMEILIPGVLMTFTACMAQPLHNLCLHARLFRPMQITGSVGPFLRIVLVVSAVLIAGDFTFVWSSEHGVDKVFWVVWLLLPVSVLLCAYQWVALLRHLRRRRDEPGASDPASWAVSRGLVREGWPLGLNAAPNYLLSYADSYLLGLLLIGDAGLEAVGIYTLAYSIFQIGTSLPRDALKATFKPTTELALADRHELSAQYARSIMLVSLLLALVLWLLAPMAVVIVGGKSFEAAADALRILLLAAPCVVLGNVFINELVIQQRSRVIPLATLIALIVNVVLNLMWIPSMGMIAAAWTTLIAYVVRTSIFAIVLARTGSTHFVAASVLLRFGDVAFVASRVRRILSRIFPAASGTRP